jgi:hypothetical protein
MVAKGRERVRWNFNVIVGVALEAQLLYKDGEAVKAVA